MIFNPDGWQHHSFPEEIVRDLLLSVTRPTYLIEIINGVDSEFLSCNGEVEFDSDNYTEGVKIQSHVLYESCTIKINATSSRISEVQSSFLKGLQCNLYLISSDPSVPLVFNNADSILMLYGIIDSSKFSGDSVSIDIINFNLAGAMCPSLMFNQFCNHIPAPGDTFDWGTDNTQIIETPVQ